MPRAALCFGLLLPVALGLCLVPPALAQDNPDFDRDVAPILVKRCLECHNARDASGGLVLTTSERTLKGGDGGEAVIPHDPAASPL
ncbi:MAG: hypothetical protein EHM42_09350, partial [Planctomycetaceae bacterium]